jgi:hypothetical protein
VAPLPLRLAKNRLLGAAWGALLGIFWIFVLSPPHPHAHMWYMWDVDRWRAFFFFLVLNLSINTVQARWMDAAGSYHVLF